MVAIVCIDDKKGMMFHHRRQSQDRAVRKDILEMTRNSRLWMNSYSAKLFQDLEAPNLMEDDRFLERIQGKHEFCFVENIGLLPYEEKIEECILYRWNRIYPADFFLDLDITDSKWCLMKQDKIIGTSHDKISKEIYVHQK